MKFVMASLIVASMVAPALAGNSGNVGVGVPEIDGALALQFIALAGGFAILLRKKHKNNKK